MDRPEKINKLEPGEDYIFEFLDENGFAEVTDWGCEVPPLRLYCVKADHGKGKCLRWDYSSFGNFIFESCGKGGQSCAKFDEWLFQKTTIRGYVLKYLVSQEEQFKQLREDRILFNRQAVEYAQDLAVLEGNRVEPMGVKIAELVNKSRFSVLSRIDPEFREKLEQKITGNIATIVIPEKDSEE